MRIRLAKESNAAACRSIYEPIVRETAISFEEVVPSVDEMARRIRSTIATNPWLVCVGGESVGASAGAATGAAAGRANATGGDVLGYAYARMHRARAAYRWTVETAIYVDAAGRGRGVGRRLYETLFAILCAQGYRLAVAGITLPNDASVRFHERLGFESLGTFRNVGFKFGAWHDTHWMQRDLNPDHAPREPIPLPELIQSGEIDAILASSAREDSST